MHFHPGSIAPTGKNQVNHRRKHCRSHPRASLQRVRSTNTASKISVSSPGFASHSLPVHCPENTLNTLRLGRGRRRSSLFLLCYCVSQRRPLKKGESIFFLRGVKGGGGGAFNQSIRGRGLVHVSAISIPQTSPWGGGRKRELAVM